MRKIVIYISILLFISLGTAHAEWFVNPMYYEMMIKPGAYTVWAEPPEAFTPKQPWYREGQFTIYLQRYLAKPEILKDMKIGWIDDGWLMAIGPDGKSYYIPITSIGRMERIK